MFRTTAARAVPKTLSVARSPVSRSSLVRLVHQAQFQTLSRSTKTSPILAVAVQKPFAKALIRHASTRVVGRDTEREKALQNEKVSAHPELVSATSSVHRTFEETGVRDAEHDDVDMMAGVKSDFKTIVDTFSMQDVPTKALYMGLAGVIPYLATSLSTVVLSFDIQYAAHHGQGLLFSGNTSEQLLHIIEPLQLGYGASIISFLGAIHWGLEWAKYGGEQGYPRYMIGVAATAVAWPTVLLPAEIGLITQFLAFTFLYYTDSRAARAGWAPRWYGIYRFVLTAIVGASIVASLIGRGQIADLISSPTGAADRMRMIRDQQLQELEETDAEGKARAARQKDDEEADDEEEE